MGEFGGAAANNGIPVSSGGSYHAPEELDTLPRGSALFVRDWTRILRNSSARDFARRYRAAGFEWIAPKLEPRARTWDEEIAGELASAGIAVFPYWGLPKPDTWAEKLERFLGWCERFGAVAPMLDPEVEWRGTPAAEARRFVNAVRERFATVLFTSYGTASAAPDFPWRAFLETTDAAFPQLYDRDLNFLPAYFERGMRSYRDRGARVVYVAGSMWAHRGDRMKTPGELARHLLQLPETTARILWAPTRISADRWAVLEAWNRGERGVLEELAASSRARARRRGGGAELAVLAMAVAAGIAAVVR